MTINEIQKKINEWIGNHGGYWPPLSMLSAVTEELGELAREINHLEGYKPKKVEEKNAGIGEELADLIYAIFCIANYYKVDLQQEIEKVIEKFADRDANRFNKEVKKNNSD